MASELNRDELAARCLVALLAKGDAFIGSPEVQRDAATVAVGVADALIARLASRPASTGSADGDARDHHGGGSLDAPYVPKVGDVVTIFGVTDFPSPDWIGSVATVVAPPPDEEGVRLRVVHSPIVPRFHHQLDMTLPGFNLRPATPAERIAAGLDEASRAPVAPAIDRERLIAAMEDARRWCVLNGNDGRTADEVNADAAIRFLNGGSA